MKKQLLLSVFLFVVTALSINAQQIIPVIQKFEVSKEVPTTILPAPDLNQLRAEDALRDKQGLLYRIGVASFVNITTENSGWWTTKENGDRQWQLKIKSEGAEALSFLFETFKLFGGSTLEIRDLKAVFFYFLPFDFNDKKKVSNNVKFCNKLKKIFFGRMLSLSAMYTSRIWGES